MLASLIRNEVPSDHAKNVLRHLPLSLMGNGAVCVGWVMVLSPSLGLKALLPMLLIMVLLQVQPVALMLSKRTLDTDPVWVRDVLRIVLVDSTLLGLFWLISMLVYLPQADFLDARFLVATVSFLTAGSAGVLQSMPRAFMAYSGPIFLGSLLISVLSWRHDGGMLCLMVLFMIVGVCWIMLVNWTNFQEFVSRNQNLDVLRREAEAARRAEMAFVENLNHEIRNAVSGVVGYFDIALESRLSEKEQHTFVANARDASGLLLNLLSDLLDVARLGAGRTPLALQPFDFREMVRLSIVSTSATMRRKTISVVSAVDDSVPLWLAGDAARIRQIIVNLVGNSIKVMNSGTVVVRATYRDEGEGWVDLSVIDDGPGMSAAQQQKVFERFSRLSDVRGPGTGPGGKGWGLGLSIVASLVELMGGRISVESEPGKGAAFHLALPLPRVPEPEPSNGIDQATEAGLRSSFSILVVDDMPMNLLVLGKMLESLGSRVTTAESGSQAVKLCQARRFDLVLMDVDMVDMDGVEATRCIRAMDNPMAQVPIVAVTGFASPEQVARVLECGMNDHVLKPIRKATVERLLARWASSAVAGEPASSAVAASTHPSSA